MCQARSATEVNSEGLVTTSVRIVKPDINSKLGVSFFADEPDDAVRVRLVHKGSLASTSGLLADDVVTCINGEMCESALQAAKVLRENTGELWLDVERHLDCHVPGEDDDDDEYMLSPPRRLFEPPSRDEHSAEYDDDDDEISDDLGYDEASADEWNEWLYWMIERIQAREVELTELQQRSAEVLATSMADKDQPPTPPKEEEMSDPMAMTTFMHAMAEYSIRQQDRLNSGGDADTEAAVEENREATAALALLVARRDELEKCRDRVHELTEVDAERIETIWRELARDGEGDEACDDDDPEYDDDVSDHGGEEEEASGEEAKVPPEATGGLVRAGRPGRRDADDEVEKILIGAPEACKPSALRTLAAVEVNANFGGHAGSLSKRLTTTKGNKLHERLQRARSSKGTLGGVAKGGVEHMADEVGALVHPI